MNYDAIVHRANVVGVQNFDQSAEAVKPRIDIRSGVCRALVIMWLESKKKRSDFWAGKGTVQQPLMSDIKRLQTAVDLQKEYVNAIDHPDAIDSITKTTLAAAGVTYAMNDVTASAQAGFASEMPVDQPSKIIEKVLLSSSRFFILDIIGDAGAHSIGIFRPWRPLVRSRHAYVFDPNIGEFKTKGADNLRALLLAINTVGYASIGLDLNKRYILFSFSD